MSNYKITRTRYGSGWLEEFNAALAILDISEDIKEKIVSEANISRNRSGGVASYYYYKIADRTLEAINEGRTPPFPLVEWNEEQKIIHAAKLKRGLPESAFNV